MGAVKRQMCLDRNGPSFLTAWQATVALTRLNSLHKQGKEYPKGLSYFQMASAEFGKARLRLAMTNLSSKTQETDVLRLAASTELLLWLRKLLKILKFLLIK